MVLSHQGSTMEPSNSTRERKKNRSKNTWITTEQPKQQQLKKLSFLYSNIDSLLNKRAELVSLIHTDNPDIICLTELLPKICKYPIQSSEFELENFKCYTNIDKQSCRRDIRVYIKDTLNAVQINTTSDLKEVIWTELKLEKQNLLIGAFYRSPNSNDENDRLIHNEIRNKSQESTNIILMDDFNYPDIA